MVIDYATPTGQVRLLTADLDETAKLLSDEQLDAFLKMNSGNVLRASADALDTVATSETLIGKKIRTQDLSTDGPAVAADLRKQAAALRLRADAADTVVVEAESGFEVIPFYSPPACELEGRR